MYTEELKQMCVDYLDIHIDSDKSIKNQVLKCSLSLLDIESVNDNKNKSLKTKFNLVYYNLSEIPKCSCGAPLEFVSQDKASVYITKLGGWREFCSRECSLGSASVIERRKSTTLERYGEDSYAKTKEFKDEFSVPWGDEKKDVYNSKRIETSLSKYGVDHYSKTSEYLEKRTQTTNDRYGVDNTFQLTDRVRAGQQKKFHGYVSWLQTDEGREYLRVSNPMFDKAISEKSRLNRYIYNWDKTPREFVDCILNFDRDAFIEIIDDLFENCNKNKKLVSDCLGIAYSTLCRYARLFGVRDRYVSPKGAPSVAELELLAYVKTLCDDVIHGDRSFLCNGKELDIFIPNKNLAIEYDGIYYHSECKGDKDKFYHIEKTHICERNGVQLLHVFENEWEDPIKKLIWKSIIKQKLGLTVNKIYARKCVTKSITSKEARVFLDNNHLAGFNGAMYHNGLYYNDELVSVMSISMDRFSNTEQYEIIRFASKIDTSVVGGMSKLFKSFNLDKPIISYADRRYSSLLNSSYSTLFDSRTTTQPSWYGFHKSDYILHHRLSYTKHKLKDLFDYDESKSAYDNMLDNGYDRIWDCGNIKFYNKK